MLLCCSQGKKPSVEAEPPVEEEPVVCLQRLAHRPAFARGATSRFSALRMLQSLTSLVCCCHSQAHPDKLMLRDKGAIGLDFKPITNLTYVMKIPGAKNDAVRMAAWYYLGPDGAWLNQHLKPRIVPASPFAMSALLKPGTTFVVEREPERYGALPVPVWEAKLGC